MNNINKYLIYVVDDEEDILELLDLQLTKAGYTVQTFNCGTAFFEGLRNKTPDFVILDLMLPDVDGIDICKGLRKIDRYQHVPILMLTAKGEELDRVLGLEIGADDYMTKPFSPRELLARIKAISRRVNVVDIEEDVTNIDSILKIDKKRYEVKIYGAKISVTTTEFKILDLLVSHPGWVFTREQILNYLWGKDKVVLDRTIDVHIRNLRAKIGSVSNYIKNIRGIGYKFEI